VLIFLLKSWVTIYSSSSLAASKFDLLLS